MMKNLIKARFWLKNSYLENLKNRGTHALPLDFSSILFFWTPCIVIETQYRDKYGWGSLLTSIIAGHNASQRRLQGLVRLQRVGGQVVPTARTRSRASALERLLYTRLGKRT